MELADGEGTQSEILRFAQNDGACMFLPFADFFTASYALGCSMPHLTGLQRTVEHEIDFVNQLLTQNTGKS
jgi:hypothetical protein